MVKKVREKGAPLYLGIDPGREGYLTAYDGERIRASWQHFMALRGEVPHRDFGSLRRLMPSERSRLQEAGSSRNSKTE